MKKTAYLLLFAFFLTACGKKTSTSESTKETEIQTEALNFYERAMDLHAEFTTERDTVTKAIALLDSAITCQPDYIAAHFSKHFYLMRLGKHEEALKTAERLNVLMPNNTEVKTLTGLLYLLNNKEEAAEAQFQQADSLWTIRLDTLSPTYKLGYLDVLMNKAIVLKFLQEEEEADKLFNQILNDSTFNAETYDELKRMVQANFLNKSKEEMYSFFVNNLRRNEL